MQGSNGSRPSWTGPRPTAALEIEVHFAGIYAIENNNKLFHYGLTALVTVSGRTPAREGCSGAAYPSIPHASCLGGKLLGRPDQLPSRLLQMELAIGLKIGLA